MNCSEIRELLSACYDGELNEASHSAVTQHLQKCSHCEAELAGFRQLSLLADQLSSPACPEDGWEQLEQQLATESTTVEDALTPQSSRRKNHLVALAVAALVVIGISSLAHLANNSQHDEAAFAAQFDAYLSKFQRDPDAAQELLLANYKHWKVEPEGPIEQIKYQPAIAEGLPEGYTAESTYVFKMPCCTCVQSLCTRKDGTKLAVFEHDDEESDDWFGARPRIDAVCHGKKCCLIELENQCAATWKHGNRYLSLIGVRDLAEVNEIVGWMEGPARE